MPILPVRTTGVKRVGAMGNPPNTNAPPERAAPPEGADSSRRTYGRVIEVTVLLSAISQRLVGFGVRMSL